VLTRVFGMLLLLSLFPLSSGSLLPFLLLCLLLRAAKQQDAGRTVPTMKFLQRLARRPGDELENAQPRVPFSPADQQAFIASGHPESANYAALRKSAYVATGSGAVAGTAWGLTALKMSKCVLSLPCCSFFGLFVVCFCCVLSPRVFMGASILSWERRFWALETSFRCAPCFILALCVLGPVGLTEQSSKGTRRRLSDPVFLPASR
jgi:hypothetical protein